MDLATLKPAPGARRRKKRVGRGIASGHGKTSGRGHKGKGSRTGGNTPPGYEGGQMPLQRRVPKRGFRRLPRNARRRAEMAIVNLDKLNRFASSNEREITPDVLARAGLVPAGSKVKILGNGELNVPLRISAHAFSESARQKVLAAGGSVTVLAQG